MVRLDLPMPVRADVSYWHLDATRGAVAVARGPLVDGVEQQVSPAPVHAWSVVPATSAPRRSLRRRTDCRVLPLSG